MKVEQGDSRGTEEISQFLFFFLMNGGLLGRFTESSTQILVVTDGLTLGRLRVIYHTQALTHGLHGA